MKFNAPSSLRKSQELPEETGEVRPEPDSMPTGVMPCRPKASACTRDIDSADAGLIRGHSSHHLNGIVCATSDGRLSKVVVIFCMAYGGIFLSMFFAAGWRQRPQLLMRPGGRRTGGCKNPLSLARMSSVLYSHRWIALQKCAQRIREPAEVSRFASASRRRDECTLFM